MHYEGTFQEVLPVAPYGYYRALIIKNKQGEQSIQVGFREIYKQTKHLKKGDQVSVDYTNYDDFTIRKI